MSGISQEYFEIDRTKNRNGEELFNANGEKFNIVTDIIEKNAKRIKDREELKNGPTYAQRKVRELIELKKAEYLKKRVQNAVMSESAKFAIQGDEYNLRVEIEKGFRMNFRDGQVKIL
jgi:phosphoketolase